MVQRPDGTVDAVASCRAEVTAFYAVEAGRLLIGTRLLDVVEGLATPPALHLTKLADLVLLEDAPDTTVCVGVMRLPIGHRLTWRRGFGAPTVRRWFDPARAQVEPVTVAQAPRVMREAIRAAVEGSLPADDSVATTLSGGLDSSMIAATTAALVARRRGTVPALTHVPLPGTEDPSPSREANDGPYAQRMAEDVPGLSWHPLVNHARVLPVDAALDAFSRLGAPVLNPANQVWLNAVDTWAADHGISVVLGGSSGNASFSRGDDGVLSQLAHEHRYPAIARQVLARARRTGSWGGAVRSVARETAPEWAVRARRSLARRAESLRQAQRFVRDAPFVYDSLSLQGRELVEYWSGPGELRSTRQDWTDFLLADASLTAQTLRPQVWWSDPFSDQEVVELAWHLPTEAWVLDGMDRGLARAAGVGLVPDYIRLRETVGYQSADVGSWIAGAEARYRAELERFRDSPSVRKFIDLDRLEASIADGLPAGRAALDWELSSGRAFGLGLFAVWYEEHVLSRARPPSPESR